MKHVSIITVNFNQPAATEDLLESIVALNTYPFLEVIVVDNGSQENILPKWIKQYPKYHFIRSQKNLGFAGGNNLGIAESTGDYLFFINNDTIITERLIEKLTYFLNDNQDYATVSPKIHYHTPSTMLQYAGFAKMNFYTGRNKCVGQFETDNGQYDNLDKLTHYAHGAAMMLRKTMIDEVGPMPENYFLYYEEMDWCETFKKAGYKIGLCMDALIYHKESLSTGKNSALKSYYMNRNRLLFIRRNANAFQLSIFYLYFITVLQAKFIVACIKERQFNQIPLFAKALVWNLRNNKTSTLMNNE